MRIQRHKILNEALKHQTNTSTYLTRVATNINLAYNVKYPTMKQLILIIGGPYGFSESIYKRAQGKISFSKMTFSHQMIRLFAVEQIYRTFTILKNEPYHHE